MDKDRVVGVATGATHLAWRAHDRGVPPGADVIRFAIGVVENLDAKFHGNVPLVRMLAAAVMAAVDYHPGGDMGCGLEHVFGPIPDPEPPWMDTAKALKLLKHLLAFNID